MDFLDAYAAFINCYHQSLFLCLQILIAPSLSRAPVYGGLKLNRATYSMQVLALLLGDPPEREPGPKRSLKTSSAARKRITLAAFHHKEQLVAQLNLVLGRSLIEPAITVLDDAHQPPSNASARITTTNCHQLQDDMCELSEQRVGKLKLQHGRQVGPREYAIIANIYLSIFHACLALSRRNNGSLRAHTLRQVPSDACTTIASRNTTRKNRDGCVSLH